MASVLLEREAERTALASAVERVAAGDGGDLVIVLGEAGFGKTALLAVAGELARAAGIRTFRAAGAPLEHDFGYGWCASCSRRSCARARRRRPRSF
jgi:AAA ATPase domain